MVRMRLVRVVALGLFGAGIGLVLFAAACSGGDDKENFQSFDTSTPTATSTSTNTATPSPTPSPTPTPFDGAVGRMMIPDLGVDYPIENIGILPSNQLDTPHNALGAIGWYHIYSKPGWGKNAVFSAHVNYNGGAGPFYRLHQIEADAEIDIQMADGPTYKYRVFSKQRYDIYNIPMGELIDRPAKPGNEEWITLITCSCEPGRIINVDANGYGECLDRDVVTARRVE